MVEHTRQRIIFESSYLLDAEGYVSLEELAKAALVSKRTVQNDLDQLCEWLKENQLSEHITVQRKSGSGILLSLTGLTREEAKRRLSADAIELKTQGNYERRLEIIKLLLFSKDALTIQFFADQFYVSKNVIQKDLDWIGKWLSRYRLSVGRYRSRGIVLVGDEIDRRSLIAEMMDTSSAPDTGQYAIPEFSDVVSLLRLDLDKFYGSIHRNSRIDVDKLADIIRSAECRYGFQLADTYYTGLLVHLSIAVERLTGGLGVVSSQDVPDRILRGREGEIASYISREISESFGVVVPQSEESLICIHIVGANINSDAGDLSYGEDMELFSKKVIALVEQLTDIPFSGDEILQQGLAMHIKTATFRLRAGLNLKRGWPEGLLKRQDSLLCYAVWAASSLYGVIFSVRPNQEELAALCAHFSLSIRRQQRTLQCLVVYGGGVMNALRLTEALKRYDAQLTVEDCCTVSQLRRFSPLSSGKYQLVVSNVPVEAGTVPLFPVSNKLRRAELEPLEEFLKSAVLRQPIPYGGAVLPVVSFAAECASPDAVMEVLSDHLTRMGYCQETAVAELLELECEGRAFLWAGCLYYLILLDDKDREQVFRLKLKNKLEICGQEVSQVLLLAARKNSLLTKSPSELAPPFRMLWEMGGAGLSDQ